MTVGLSEPVFSIIQTLIIPLEFANRWIRLGFLLRLTRRHKNGQGVQCRRLRLPVLDHHLYPENRILITINKLHLINMELNIQLFCIDFIE